MVVFPDEEIVVVRLGLTKAKAENIYYYLQNTKEIYLKVIMPSIHLPMVTGWLQELCW